MDSMIPYQDAEALLAEAGLSFQDFVLLTGASYSATFSLASVQRWIAEPMYRAATEITVRMSDWSDVQEYMSAHDLNEDEEDWGDVASVLGYYVNEKGEVEFRDVKNAPKREEYPYFIAWYLDDKITPNDLLCS